MVSEPGCESELSSASAIGDRHDAPPLYKTRTRASPTTPRDRDHDEPDANPTAHAAMMPRADGGPVLLAPPPPPPPPPCSFLQPFPFVLHPHHLMGGGMLQPQTEEQPAPAVEVRDVWAANLEEELAQVAALLPLYPCVCVDTEFPGVVHGSATPHHLRGAREAYAVVKRNVDELKLLQVGVALCGPGGRCPVAWQFNLRGFDAGRDAHAADSVAMLRAQGMDFAALRDFGVDPRAFAAGFFRCGLGCGRLTWVAFSGAYDFAYLARLLLGGCRLPETLESFLAQVAALFGPAVVDVKRLARFCGDGGGLRGGLEQVAAALGVDRAAGRAHCAGSDSLLTCDVLLAMMSRFFQDGNVLHHAGAIEGLV
ncbi:hypothetical protein ACP4OV_017201 [Aristida adscensionis]